MIFFQLNLSQKIPMNELLFERCLVYVVNRLADDLYDSETAFAEKVFTDTSSPVNAWRAVRNGQKGGFRKVSVREAWNMASAIGMSIDTLFFKVVRELDEGWSLDKDISVHKVKKAGRPPKKGATENQKTDICGPTQLSADDKQTEKYAS